MTNKQISVSVVMPCLNEEEAIEGCVEQAIRTLKKHKILGEVVVSDNGSTDGSVSFAKKAGARVVFARDKGYGSAYLKGLSEAKGDILIMGDSDGTYDFSQIPIFLNKIYKGYDFVNGNRLAKASKGAFSFSHRYIGVPILTNMLNLFFGTKFSDAHCGMRAFTKEAYHSMDLHCHGMEFASEMIVKAAGLGLKTTEIPIHYLPRIGESKLISFRDAWRHVRFMLLFAPTFLFMIPGALLSIFGLSFLIWLLPETRWIFNIGLDVHTMLFASGISIFGINILSLGLFAKLFALFGNTNLIKSKTVRFFMNSFNQEDWIKGGLTLFSVGLAISFYVFYEWLKNNFGGLAEIRLVVLAVTMMIIGMQVIFASFVASLMIDRYKKLI